MASYQRKKGKAPPRERAYDLRLIPSFETETKKIGCGKKKRAREERDLLDSSRGGPQFFFSLGLSPCLALGDERREAGSFDLADKSHAGMYVQPFLGPCTQTRELSPSNFEKIMGQQLTFKIRD